jgi:hypothetical protein
LTFDKCFCTNKRSHEQRCVLRPLIHWLIKKTSDKKRGNPKKCKGAHKKRPPMKKRQQKNAKRLIQKDL